MLSAYIHTHQTTDWTTVFSIWSVVLNNSTEYYITEQNIYILLNNSTSRWVYIYRAFNSWFIHCYTTDGMNKNKVVVIYRFVSKYLNSHDYVKRSRASWVVSNFFATYPWTAASRCLWKSICFWRINGLIIEQNFSCSNEK